MFATFQRFSRLIKIALGLRAARKAETGDDQERAKAALANIFADARGATMKIGQLFSEVGDDGPFDVLAKGVEPYSFAKMKPVLEGGLGKKVEDVFASIEEHAIAASLGQVHRATLHDGTTVAVKIRYPGIVEAVNGEMKLAGMIPGIGPAKKWGIDLDGYKRTLKENMDRELDYRTEAKRQVAFKNAMRVDGLSVPTVYQEFSSDCVLVQSWEQGEYLDAVLNWPDHDRQRVAEIILSTLLSSLFMTGIMHGDPHMGNALYRHDEGAASPQMILLDYGCTISLQRPQQEALLELILAYRDGGHVPVFEYLCDMGFDREKLSYIKEELLDVGRLLLHPFLIDTPLNDAAWGLKDAFEELLGERRWWLRSSGPPESLLTVRVFHGAISQLDKLDSSVVWWDLMQSVIPKNVFGAAQERLRQKRRDIMTDTSKDNVVDKPALAAELRVHVSEGQKMVVSMTMPARAAYDLPNIMPGDVVDFINTSTDIDLDVVVDTVIETKAAPQILFELDRGARHYKVWLV